MVEELDINSVSDIDMENFNKVNEFITLKSKDKKDKNKIKNILINLLSANRDLVGEDLLSKIDFLKFFSGSLNLITDEDVDVVYNYLLDKYHNDTIMEALYIKTTNKILYDYIREQQGNIDYTRLYMNFRNNQLNSNCIYFKYYKPSYPAELVKILKQFIYEYHPHDWKKFYLTHHVITDLINYFIFDNNYNKGNLMSRCCNIFNMYYNPKQDPEILDDSQHDELYKNLYSGPLAVKRSVEEVDGQKKFYQIYDAYDKKQDETYEKAVMTILDDYYINKLYNNYVLKEIVVVENKDLHEAESGFTKEILVKYPNFIDDMDKVKSMISYDSYNNLFDLFLNKKIDADAISHIISNISEKFIEYFIKNYVSKILFEQISYGDLKYHLV